MLTIKLIASKTSDFCFFPQYLRSFIGSVDETTLQVPSRCIWLGTLKGISIDSVQESLDFLASWWSNILEHISVRILVFWSSWSKSNFSIMLQDNRKCIHWNPYWGHCRTCNRSARFIPNFSHNIVNRVNGISSSRISVTRPFEVIPLFRNCVSFGLASLSSFLFIRHCKNSVQIVSDFFDQKSRFLLAIINNVIHSRSQV